MTNKQKIAKILHEHNRRRFEEFAEPTLSKVTDEPKPTEESKRKKPRPFTIGRSRLNGRCFMGTGDEQ